MQNHSADYQPKNYIDQSMRMIVISWLVEVACEYELHQETLFLATALLDRFMSLAKVCCVLCPKQYRNPFIIATIELCQGMLCPLSQTVQRRSNRSQACCEALQDMLFLVATV